MPGPTHGKTGTPEYVIWEGMLARCRNSNRPRYESYGGRGIRVCERWHDFASFISDMGVRPGPGFSIERDNSEGNYEPSNCRWATRSEQQRHKRRARNNRSGHTGVTWDRNRSKWLAWIKLAGKSNYLGGFSDIECAVDARKAAEKAHNFHPQHGR